MVLLPVLNCPCLSAVVPIVPGIVTLIINTLQFLHSTQSVFRSVKHLRHSFAFDAPKIWNELPNDVRCATSVASFRKKLKTYPFAIASPMETIFTQSNKSDFLQSPVLIKLGCKIADFVILAFISICLLPLKLWTYWWARLTYLDPYVLSSKTFKLFINVNLCQENSPWFCSPYMGVGLL